MCVPFLFDKSATFPDSQLSLVQEIFRTGLFVILVYILLSIRGVAFSVTSSFTYMMDEIFTYFG